MLLNVQVVKITKNLVVTILFLLKDGHVQRTGSSSSVGSGDGSSSSVPPSIRREEPTSLIDFSADPEPSIIIKQSDPFELGASIQSSADTSNITDWASFDMFSTPATGPSPPTTTLPPLSAPMPSTQGGGIANQPSQVNGNMQWAPLSSAVQSSSDTWSVGFGQPSKPVANAQVCHACLFITGQFVKPTVGVEIMKSSCFCALSHGMLLKQILVQQILLQLYRQ